MVREIDGKASREVGINCLVLGEVCVLVHAQASISFGFGARSHSMG